MSHRYPRPTWIVTAAVSLAVLASPSATEAHPTPTDPPSRASDPDPELRLRAIVLGGVHGLRAVHLHPYGGIEAGAFLGRFGLMGLGQYGRGNGYESLLLAAGPAMEVVDLGFSSVTAYTGAARYGENTELGYSRRQLGFHGALSVRIPLPVGALGLTAFAWHGGLAGEGVEHRVGLTSYRLSVGFGL